MFWPISEAESILKHQLQAYKPNTITAINMAAKYWNTTCNDEVKLYLVEAEEFNPLAGWLFLCLLTQWYVIAFLFFRLLVFQIP